MLVQLIEGSKLDPNVNCAYDYLKPQGLLCMITLILYRTISTLTRTIELDWWQSIKLKEAIITMLPAQHWSRREMGDRNKSLWASYGITDGALRVYFAGDSGFGPHFKMIKNRWGAPTLSLLPIGAYEPRWFMKDNHLTPNEAVIAHGVLNGSYALGIHFDVFQLGDEKFNQALIDLDIARKQHQVDKEQFFTLPLGSTWTLG